MLEKYQEYETVLSQHYSQMRKTPSEKRLRTERATKTIQDCNSTLQQSEGHRPTATAFVASPENMQYMSLGTQPGRKVVY